MLSRILPPAFRHDTGKIEIEEYEVCKCDKDVFGALSLWLTPTSYTDILRDEPRIAVEADAAQTNLFAKAWW